MKILVTGGLGYIGSHTVVRLLEENMEVVIVDNLINSKKDVLEKIETITGKRPIFYEADVCDFEKMDAIFQKEQLDGIIHFAGLKAVFESVQNPTLYYRNNLVSTINLCDFMKKYAIEKIIFSSSATVYGEAHTLPIVEDFPLSTTNPYGSTKLMCEQILTDFQKANPRFSVTLLRYFNPIGAHESGLLFEDPNGIPNNLMPYIVKVALGELDHLNVFGNDYETKDGTGVRDFIHVMDLAEGHLLALQKQQENGNVSIYNLGTGEGYSVLELIDTFERVNGISIPYQIEARRKGDIAACYSDPTKAKKELGFVAKRNLEEMCRSAWKAASRNR